MIDTDPYKISAHLKQLITSGQAFHYRIVPIANNKGIIHFKTDADNLLQLKTELSIILNCNVLLLKEREEIIQTYLSTNYREVKSTINQHLNFKDNFLEQLISTAKEFGSSDIHLEPYQETSRVRFRLDGKLKEQFIIKKEEYPQLINKIKIQAGLDISQKRLAQDGRISFKKNGYDFDIRVSTMPTLYGEKVVLRLLNKNTKEVRLDELGFFDDQLIHYRESIKKSQGVILISGPTGSGKTTTLYASLKELNKEITNILTIEDPIEYTLQGINQVQLREDIGFDFPAALRTFLRQDPDIIMVGEIRDNKTADMAIKAALTGHLVLSTIHTNSAWATISRLIDMKVPEFLISSTLIASVAQRLVRILCESCKEEISLNKSELPPNTSIPHNLTKHFIAKGCNKCYQTGYTGRKAIYEVLPVTKELAHLIILNPVDIDDYLIKKKIKTLKDTAFELIIKGETSIDEVYSIIGNS
ncbi:GspE/PulE family protein [Aquimarina sp. W85]|uniref:GspE/PulE family protein n=1 Tax=Aquimarina rhodophyticola TaxID=3342246 RepID=UPI00366AA760